MHFVNSDTANTFHPTDALFDAHFKSSVLMAVYLIGGASLAAVALLGVAYSPQMSSTWALVPYALMVTALLWFALGALWIHKHEQHLERCSSDYQSSVHQRTQTPYPTVAPSDMDEPWELHAFWGQAASTPSHTMARHNARSAVVPPAAPHTRLTPSMGSAAHDPGTTMEVALIASMTKHKPLRPISLFGSVQ